MNDSTNNDIEPKNLDEKTENIIQCPINLDEIPNEQKSRFNLRKRANVFIGEEDYDIDEEEDMYPVNSMPRLSKNHRKGGKRQRPYTNEAIKSAVKMVLSKKMSILDAGKNYNIPRTSLHNYVTMYKKSRRHGIKSIGTSALNCTEEKEIVDLVLKLSKCGKRYSHNELRYLVQIYLINNDRPVFKSGTLPTMGWIAGLVERNPELVLAKSKKNTKVAAEDVEEWYENISKFLIDEWSLDLGEIFSSSNSSRIFCFNAFKININGPADNSENKTGVKKEQTDQDRLEQEVGIILGMSASGTFFSPVVVLGSDSEDFCAHQDPSVLRVMFNKIGRIDNNVALAVVRDFHAEVVKKQVPKPIIFFVNDKQDFAHFSVIEYCWENEICIICLPPRTTRTMTPFEVSIWPKIRATYSSLWKNAPKNVDNKISVSQFPNLFIETWESVRNPKVVSRSFAKAGLIPFDIKSLIRDSPSDSFYEPVSVNTTPKSITNERHELSVTSPVDSSVKSEDRSRGKIEGIQMCLQAIESFIPADILPIWTKRDPNFKGRCEMSFKLWRSVSLLLKAGCAMASIQQMADGFNPFELNSAALNNSADPEEERFKQEAAPRSPVTTKRKLNKSIYSKSDHSHDVKKTKYDPTVRLQHSAFPTNDFNGFDA